MPPTSIRIPPQDGQSTPTPTPRVRPFRPGFALPFAGTPHPQAARVFSPHHTPTQSTPHPSQSKTTGKGKGKEKERPQETVEYTILPAIGDGKIEPVPPALYCPIWKVDERMRGRKVRLVGQVLHYNPKKATIILTAQPEGLCRKCPTIVVNISIPLLAPSPSQPPPPPRLITPGYTSLATRSEPEQRAVVFNTDQPPHPSSALSQSEVEREGLVGREMVRFGRGDWVGVVGWLEDGRDLVRKIRTFGAYAPPPPVVCEAIHITNARPPPKSRLPQAGVGGGTGIVRVMSEIDTRWQEAPSRPSEETKECTGDGADAEEGEGPEEEEANARRLKDKHRTERTPTNKRQSTPPSPPHLSPRTPPEISRADGFEVRILLPGESANYEDYDFDVTPKPKPRGKKVKVGARA
ncbi:hypothetical protein L202_01922 [Cryptococcus amylolentus CBS 6039]|uniref:Uncharacterized protein n=2 Tax=Cryptococcus amylolentus TaxID=104669 RepID=A0A1E3HYT4_9TREE|nr:hypothetical protein L202_01922 [Cryptococcus amylolentus CBS 6039]ODN81500.1 hypothetical protein L202_01922 [Cryptococcus amylolentus CBS 6039]ODO10267.1 hypothetical protein I350_02496 [Cryptococcus amylolentus CBS 6273]